MQHNLVGVGVRELSRYLLLVGALPFLFLGTAHVVHTPRLPNERKGLSPSDPSLAEAMTRSRVLLTSRTDMWRAWVGLNLSHSLGMLLFGAVVVLVGRTPVSFGHNAAIFFPLAVVVSLAYLTICVSRTGSAPLIGISVSVVLFAAAWVLYLVGRGKESLWRVRMILAGRDGILYRTPPSLPLPVRRCAGPAV